MLPTCNAKKRNETQRTQVVVGRDNRESSPAMRDAVVRGLLAAGCRVVDIGTVITPAFYFARVHLGIDGGVMITASHNPAEFNGFKLAHGFGALYGEEIQEVRRLRVVVDCGNGTASLVAPAALQDLGCEVIPLYCESDPRFPNHHPDPVQPENLQDLIARVRVEGADWGSGSTGMETAWAWWTIEGRSSGAISSWSCSGGKSSPGIQTCARW